MTKQKFLEMMRLSLNGKVSSSLVMENLRYYEDYINVEIRKGRDESEVLNELGDPRLIARTIAQTSGMESDQSTDFKGNRAWQEAQDAGYRPGGHARQFFLKVLFRVPMWVWLILLLLIVTVILGVVFSVIGAILPVLLPIVLVLLLVKVFRDWIN